MDYRLLVSIIKHRLQEATKRPLILLGNAAVTLNDLSLIGAEPGIDRSPSEENEPHVDAQGGDAQQISTVRIPYPALIASLSVPIYPARLGEILLAEAQPNSFFA